MDRRLGRRQPTTATSYLLLLAVMVAIVAGALITRQTTAQAGTVGNTDNFNASIVEVALRSCLLENHALLDPVD